MSAEDRSSNIDFEDCPQCVFDRPGVCSNCEADGGSCPECKGTGRCVECEGTGRKPYEPTPEERAEIQAAGPLIDPYEVDE